MNDAPITPQPVFRVDGKPGKWIVCKTDGVLGERWARCHARIDAEIICQSLNSHSTEEFTKITSDSVGVCDKLIRTET